MSKLAVREDILIKLNFIRRKKQEYFVCFSLDSSGQIITRRIVTIGLLDFTLVHPREVFAGPLKDRAKAIIVVHKPSFRCARAK
jgi:DNA repair protein RadC